jgi:hypothetical protein
MDLILTDLNDLGGDWNAQMGSCTTETGTMYAVRITVETTEGEEIVRGAIDESLLSAVENAVDAITTAIEEGDYEESLNSATEVLQATLDELGFDRAVALLERLNNC